jgi:hypothetical protein
MYEGIPTINSIPDIELFIRNSPQVIKEFLLSLIGKRGQGLILDILKRTAEL